MQITFLRSKTREQPRATNYQLTLGRGLKALSSPFWQETLRWCAKWVKAHPKSHNRSGLPFILLPPSSRRLPTPAEGSDFKSHRILGVAEVEGVRLNRKRRALKCEHAASSGHSCASESLGGQRLRLPYPGGGCIFLLQGSAVLPLTPTVMCDPGFSPPLPSPVTYLCVKS